MTDAEKVKLLVKTLEEVQYIPIAPKGIKGYCAGCGQGKAYPCFGDCPINNVLKKVREG